MSEGLLTTRECGDRKQGAIYMECGEKGPGIPLIQFICDPAKSVDVDALGISPVGVHMVNVGGVVHVFDWVGSENYKNVADFVEEMRVLGISRRIPKTFDFSLLGPHSRLYLIHSRACVEVIRGELVPYSCPLERHELDDPECSGKWWSTIEPGMTVPIEAPAPKEAFSASGSKRVLACKREFVAAECSLDQVVFSPGVFMILPIERLVAIRDQSDDDANKLNIAAMQKSSLPCFIEDL